MSNFKDTVNDAADAATSTAKDIGSKIAKGASSAADFVKEKTGMGDSPRRGAGAIEERMDVIASCGKKIGVVDHLEGNSIKLTRKDSPDGMHHFIPKEWVESVDDSVHLSKNSVETERGWKPTAESCGC